MCWLHFNFFWGSLIHGDFKVLWGKIDHLFHFCFCKYVLKSLFLSWEQRNTNTDIDRQISTWASQVALVENNPPANTGDTRDVGSVPGWGGPLGGGHSNPLQYSCLENPMVRGDWRATAQKIAELDTTEVT